MSRNSLPIPWRLPYLVPVVHYSSRVLQSITNLNIHWSSGSCRVSLSFRSESWIRSFCSPRLELCRTLSALHTLNWWQQPPPPTCRHAVVAHGTAQIPLARLEKPRYFWFSDPLNLKDPKHSRNLNSNYYYNLKMLMVMKLVHKHSP